MKSKDIIGLAILGILLAAVGVLLLGSSGSGQKRTAEIEVVRDISSEFNTEARSIILGQEPDIQVDTFSPPLDLENGFGNNDPFRR